MSTSPRVVANPLLRVVCAVVGVAFLAVGVVGIWMPGLPGVLFLLIALWFFSLSSERLHAWMLHHPWFGSTLRDYHAGLGIARRTKTVAVVSIVVAVTISIAWFVADGRLRFGLVGLGAFGIWFILSRPTREIVERERAERVPATGESAVP